MPNNSRAAGIRRWFTNHIQAICFAGGEVFRSPGASILTTSVIAIALALPYGLHSILNSLEPIENHISTKPNISMYIDSQMNATQLTQLQSKIQNFPQVVQSTYTSPGEAIKKFSLFAKIGDILEGLKTNPLPGLITITPALNSRSPQQIQQLSNQLNSLPHVLLVQINMTWVKRLYYLLQFSRRFVFSLAIIFAIGVILIVGNTIRLVTQKHKEDINIMKLLGANASFIRRPLIYRGLLLGILGGMMAWAMVTAIVWWLAAPLQAFLTTYQSSLTISQPSISDGLYIVALGTCLSGVGSWLALSSLLRQSEN